MNDKFSQLRGEVKAAARSHVKASYGINPSSMSKDEVNQRVRFLLTNLNYIFRVPEEVCCFYLHILNLLINS